VTRSEYPVLTLHVKRRRIPSYVLGMGLICFLAAAFCGFNAWKQARLAGADVSTTCTVVAWETNKDDPDVPRITIAHELAGERYTRTDEGTETAGANKYQSIGTPTPGAKVPCWYVRGHPDLVIVFRDRPAGGLALFGAVALILLPLGFLIYESTRRRPRFG
jgi:hypothetical protein